MSSSGYSGRNDQKQTFTCKRVFEGAVIRRREKTGNWEKQQAIKENNRKGEGYPEGGIAPGTKWEDVPEDFECPLCNVGKDQFSEVE